MDNAKTVTPTAKLDRAMMAKALLMESGAMCRPKISSLSLPRARLMMFKTAMAKVVVLIPPPVDPGAAPIHISNTDRRMDGDDRVFISTMENPAARVLFPMKNAATHLPQNEWCSWRAFPYSNT